eukprot:scaffold28230_cov69-Phaeocystis_antarctica.AAC.2
MHVPSSTRPLPPARTYHRSHVRVRRGRWGAPVRDSALTPARAFPPTASPRAAWRRAARLQIVRLHDLSVPIVPDAREREYHEEEEVEGGAVRGGRGEHLLLDLLFDRLDVGRLLLDLILVLFLLRELLLHLAQVGALVVDVALRAGEAVGERGLRTATWQSGKWWRGKKARSGGAQGRPRRAPSAPQAATAGALGAGEASDEITAWGQLPALGGRPAGTPSTA